MKILSSCLIALTACNPVDARSGDRPMNGADAHVIGRQTDEVRPGRSSDGGRTLPAKYIKAFMCEFDENPKAAIDRFHKTPGGRAERAGDLTLLRSLGFSREASDYGLESVGGKIPAPTGLTIFGLPVKYLEINGMLGDTNALYVTTFADGVAVAQVVKAARLTMNRADFTKYKLRYYDRHIGSNPYSNLSLSDRDGSDDKLICQVRTTPD